MLEKGEMKNEEMKKRMEELRSSSSSSAALKSVDQKFREIDKLFEKFSERNHEQLSNAEIKPIHEKYPFAQNGICAFIAPMGSGKSYNYMKLSAKQEVLFAEPFFELIVI